MAEWVERWRREWRQTE